MSFKNWLLCLGVSALTLGLVFLVMFGVQAVIIDSVVLEYSHNEASPTGRAILGNNQMMGR